MFLNPHFQIIWNFPPQSLKSKHYQFFYGFLIHMSKAVMQPTRFLSMQPCLEHIAFLSFSPS
jgi:hypothetical protein